MPSRKENKMIIKEASLNVESKSVQLHLEFLQDIISRLSSKSSTCKNWCITLTSAFILLSLRLDNGSKYILLSYIPIIIFCLLDIYYVYLEKHFRESYDEFVKKLHTKKLKKSDIYVINGNLLNTETKLSYISFKLNIVELMKNIIPSCQSPSIIIFYTPLLIINIIISIVIYLV